MMPRLSPPTAIRSATAQFRQRRRDAQRACFARFGFEKALSFQGIKVIASGARTFEAEMCGYFAQRRRGFTRSLSGKHKFQDLALSFRHSSHILLI